MRSKLLFPGRLGLELKRDGDHDLMGFDVELKLLPAKAAEGENKEVPAGTLEGYASVFDVMDRGGDIVLPGAFKKTLTEWRKRKSLPPMLWMHDAREPVGVWTSITEDEKGLKVTGELILDVPMAKTVHALLLRGAVKGLSIGYRSSEDEIDRATGARKLKRVELFEISLVTIPQLPEALVSAVKSDAVRLPTDRELEKAFRDGGLSQREARIAVGVVKSEMKEVSREERRPEQQPPEGAAEALNAIRKATEKMKA